MCPNMGTPTFLTGQIPPDPIVGLQVWTFKYASSPELLPQKFERVSDLRRRAMSPRGGAWSPPVRPLRNHTGSTARGRLVH
jgi:hypothetical protein